MKKKIFISYSYADKEFVEWLKNELENSDFEIWYDQEEIQVGDSIIDRINTGIHSSDAFIIVLSNSSKNSDWVKYEFNSAVLLSAIKKGIKVLPIKIDDSEIPTDLSGYLYADFSKNREQGLQIIKKSLGQITKAEYEFKDWSNFDWRKFEDLIFDLLNKEGLVAVRTPPTRDGGYDFIAKTQNIFGKEENIIIESKFYTHSKISINILEKLYALASKQNIDKVLLITNSELTYSSRNFLIHSAPNLIVWEGHDLISKLFSYPDLVKKYFPSEIAKKPTEKIIDEQLIQIQKLTKRLDECPEGKTGWKEYEDICIDILNHLFVPPLGEPKIQSRRESGIDIRDAIFPNRNNNENWKFIRDDYDAKYIVFEFKNYSKDGSEVDKQVLLQIDDYLKKTIGRFGIICSKKNPNNSGLEKRKDIFIENNKLIIFLSNENLKEMLLRKHKGLDPSDVIIDLIDDFNLKF